MLTEGFVISDEAKRIYAKTQVWDMLVPMIHDTKGPVIWDRAGVTLFTYANDGITLPMYRESGINVICFSPAADQLGPETALQLIGQIYAFCAKNPDQYAMAYTVDEIDSLYKAGKTPIFFMIQGTNCLGGNLEMLEVFYRLGVRSMIMAYNQKNLVGDGCAERTDGGLSRFGLSVIKEMNRLGMICDGTHAGYKTSMEMMEASNAPCAFTHSNAYGVFPHYRNIKDDQIKKCAETGGVIGISSVGDFLRDPLAKSDAIFKHIDYIVNLVGPQHVGLGFDFVRDTTPDPAQNNVDAWPTVNGEPILLDALYGVPAQYLELVEYMLRAGYPEKAIRGILGENWRRICKEVWK
ncbi:MAG: dipeptidase [Firmicutes bacterium]|nr:dipeptidase [Bacillota bacterium]